MTGIILSGGKSTRMGGSNKAFLEVQGERLIDRTVRLFKSLFEEVILVTNSPLDYIDQDIRIVTDIIKGKGALGGIFSGLFFSSSSQVFAAACDMPFLKKDIIDYMIQKAGGHDIIVPFLKNGYQPLHAIYSRKCAREIEKQMKTDNLKISAFYHKFRILRISEAEIHPFDPEGKIFFNVNSKEDMENACLR
jgi:molybdopterin-guanine dinucleotide biosynthesis protein A